MSTADRRRTVSGTRYPGPKSEISAISYEPKNRDSNVGQHIFRVVTLRVQIAVLVKGILITKFLVYHQVLLLIVPDFDNCRWIYLLSRKNQGTRPVVVAVHS